MKKHIALFLLFISQISLANNPEPDYSTPDKLIAAFYACLNVQAGKTLDSARLTNLFYYSNAQIAAVVQSRKDTSKIKCYSMLLTQYIASMKTHTDTNRFWEWETGRQTISFANQATIYSAYAMIDVNSKGDTTKESGINILHLFFDGKRWWILSCNYEEASAKYPIPEAYRKKED
ncbi:MAG: hypothetical protein ACRCYO_14610 [Bacteroidia bacterium]